MADSVESFERGVVFRMGRGVGLVATLFGVLMVIGGGFVVTKTVSAYLAAHRAPSVAVEEVRAELKPDPLAPAAGEGAALADEPTTAVPDCPTDTTDGIANAIGNDQDEKPTAFEQARMTRILRGNCEDLDESYRAEFLSEGGPWRSVTGPVPRRSPRR